MRAQASRRVLVYVWDTCLRLLHPFMPFLTEALWQLIPHSGDSIMVADWPQLEDSEALPLDHTAGTTQYNTLILIQIIIITNKFSFYSLM